MTWEINGRTVLITGAARGIGAETAVRLHQRGANVALVGLEPELLEQLAARLGDRAAAFEADVTDADAVERAVAGAVQRFGGVDVAVANAGIHFVGSVAGAPIEGLRRVIDVNLGGVLNTVRAAAPHVVARRGYLLNVASLAAASHAPLMGAYAASKAGVEALTDCLRQELRPAGARVGCAYFGFIDTDLVRSSMDHASSRTLERMLPGFVRRPVPVSAAADAIERGILRRSARVWAPRYLGPALALRGVMQPLFEQRVVHDRRLARGLDQADVPAADGVPRQDPVLGIAAVR
jgi:NAD(P)-dependent dehydrogenase (short-subunit alcohol dehydrogenase family)